MKKSVTSNVIYNMLFQFFTTFLPVITTPYLSRTLGVSQSGVYSFVESIVTLFTVFGAIGTSLYGCRMIAYVRDDKQKLSQTAYEIFMLKFLILIPVIIIYIVLFCISGKYSIYFIVNILTVIGSAIEISWFFNGVEDFKLVTMRNFIIKIIFVVCLFIFIKSPDDLFKYVLLVCVSNFIGNLSMWICLPKYLLSIRKIEKLKPFKHLKESFKLFIPQSANYVYSLSDKTMLGILTPTLDNVGIYDYSYRIVKMIISILQSIGYVILSRIANLSSKKDNEGIKKYIYKSINFSLFLALPMMFGLIGISNTFVPLYLGSEFIEVSKVIIIISPLVIITSFNSILGVQLLLAIKKDKQYTIATVSGAIINILLNLIFIPVLGIYGACITSLFSEICVLIIQLYYSKEFISIIKILKDNIKPFVFSIIIVLICNLISIININALLVLLLQIIISSLVYFALMFFFKDEIFMEILSKTMSLFKKKKSKKRSA